MVESFYTRFRFEMKEIGDRRCIGLAYFELTKTWYPDTAIVKTFYDRAEGRKEAESTAKCSSLHRNLIQTYAFYETSSSFVLFLEHCHRGSLYDYLLSPTSPRQPQSVLLSLMLDVATAVSALHSNHLAHRDIKPHNVFVTRNCVCKLGDLETVKEVQMEDASLASIPKGTVAYMSPEKLSRLIANRESQANQAFAEDVWALGKTFLEMCIGAVITDLHDRCPDAASQQSFIQQSVLAHDFSESLSVLICRMMANERQLSIQEVCSALASISTGSVRKPLMSIHRLAKCQLCRQSSDIVQLSCGHTYCSLHMLQHISSRIAASQTLRLQDITCIHCETPISPDIIANNEALLAAELLVKLQKLSLVSAEVVCACKCKYEIVHWHGDQPKPYLYKCAQCGAKLCSWCTAKNGHKSLLGKTKKCPQFPFYAK